MLEYTILYLDIEMNVLHKQPFHGSNIKEVLRFLNEYEFPNNTMSISIILDVE